jgi:hypothetical protein
MPRSVGSLRSTNTEPRGMGVNRVLVGGVNGSEGRQVKRGFKEKGEGGTGHSDQVCRVMAE